MLTSIATYGVTWALLGSEDAGTDHLSKNDAPVFRVSTTLLALY